MGIIDLHEFDVSAVLAELKRFSKLHPDVDPHLVWRVLGRGSAVWNPSPDASSMH
jgi:hypothetical protein